MQLAEVMKELERLGSAQTKKTLMKHGAPEPLFGVKVGDLKPLAKKLKGRQELALQLYATGNSDAMYLAGLFAQGSEMTREELDDWAHSAKWQMIAGYSVPWAASEHGEGYALALEWIDSPLEFVAVAGWSTLAAIVSMRPDNVLPIKELGKLLDRCVKTLHRSANRVRYAMNGFVISVGTYCEPLAEKALQAADKIGEVVVEHATTDCKTPDARSYIMKSRKNAAVAPKRKTCRC